jgi:hypothetical protein
MSFNPYKRLLGLLPQRPLSVGEVLAVSDGVVTVELPGGAQIQARGEATVGDKVFVRDGAIEGPAPDLPIEEVEV